MKGKGRRKKTKGRGSRNPSFISPELFLKGGRQTEVVVVRRLQKKLNELSRKREKMGIFEIAKNPMLPKSMVPLFSSPETFRQFYNAASFIKSELYPYWCIGLLIQNADLIKKFNLARTSFNASLLRSDDSQASKYLDAIDNISASWWGIESRVHLLKEVHQKSAKKEIQKIEKLFTNESCKRDTQRLLMMSESTSINLFSEFIRAQLKEYRSSGEESAERLADALSCMSLPISMDPERAPELSSLYVYSPDSLIDQYVLLKSIVSQINVRDLPANLKSILLELASKVNDTEMTCLLSAVERQMDPLVEKIVELYTEGDYVACTAMIEKEMGGNSLKSAGMLEIYGRSKVYSSQNFGDDLFNRIAESLMSIANISSTCVDEISYIKKLSVKFRNESWAKSLNFHLTCMLEESEGSEIVDLTREQLKGFSELNTPKAVYPDRNSWVLQSANYSRIPEQRRARYGISKKIYSIYDPSQFSIRADYLVTQVISYMDQGDWLEAMNFCVAQYISDPLSKLFLPLQKLCEIASTIDKKTNDNYILCLLIIDIFSMEINSSYDEVKSEIFDEYLEFNDTHLPSSIFLGLDLTDKNFYFLKNVCIPSELDNIIYFESNDDVIFERIKILDLLIASSSGSVDSLKDEKDRVIEALFSSKLRARIESGKLFVDVQALESRKKDTYRSLFEAAKSILDGVALENLEEEHVELTENIFEIDSSGDLPVAITSNEKTETVLKIFRQIVRDFAMNEDYGLDKYLSAEIRHFVFVSQLRSCFEKYNIITSSENNLYLPNFYWRQRYDYINDRILDAIDLVFASFSSNIDQYLKDTNNLFKVTSENRNLDEYSENTWIFDFSSYYSRIVDLSEIIINSENFDEFFNSLLQYMWGICAEHARQAQRLINDGLKVKILDELYLLERSINNSKGQAAMVDLIQDIRSAKSEFLNQIEVVLNWFKPAGSDNSSSLDSLRVVIEATITAFESIYKHKSGQLNISLLDSTLCLNYREARSLFVALFTALENASSYKCDGSDISLCQISKDGRTLISVSNEISAGSILEPTMFVDSQKAKFNENNAKLSRQEGGSGLFKIYNHLKNSSEGFFFDLDIEYTRFSAIIGLRDENFTCRR